MIDTQTFRKGINFSLSNTKKLRSTLVPWENNRPFFLLEFYEPGLTLLQNNII